MTAVCDTLRDECKPIWEELHSHPFIDEMQAGTLPERKFAFYIGQNILFLVELARAMALGVAKADDEATMKDFAEIVSNIINIELPTNRALLARLQRLPRMHPRQWRWLPIAWRTRVTCSPWPTAAAPQRSWLH